MARVNTKRQMEDVKLTRKLRALRQRVALIESLAAFLVKHPAIASRCELKQMGTTVGLYFEDKAVIRPVGKTDVSLRLEKWIDDWEPFTESEKPIVCGDVSALSPQELSSVLKEVEIDLSKPADGDDDDD